MEIYQLFRSYNKFKHKKMTKIYCFRIKIIEDNTTHHIVYQIRSTKIADVASSQLAKIQQVFY